MHRVAVIILAAGRSTRFAGSMGHKLLVPVAGVPIVRWSAQRALDASVGTVCVVVGAEAEAIAAAVSDLPVRIVHAEQYADGMAESLRAGVAAVRADADAVVFALADQPTMRPDAYRQVVDAWTTTGAVIVRPGYARADTPAHPTLFSSVVFDQLLALRGDAGARAVITREIARVVTVALDWPAPRDIDTTDDLAIVAAELNASTGDDKPRTNISNSSVN